DLPPQQAIPALNAARLRRIVWTGAQGTRCVFVHDRLRQALLERMPAAEARRLHEQAAIQLEGAEPQRSFELAYHFDEAGAGSRALPYALVAGEQARAQHALELAERQFLIAERVAEGAHADTATRRRIHEGL